MILEVIFGTNDDDTFTLRVIQRIARRFGGRVVTVVPGIIYLMEERYRLTLEEIQVRHPRLVPRIS